jgi:hypothetical protein
MIKTVAEYRTFLDSLRDDLNKTWEEIPERERNERALKIAAELNVSQTTVLNYMKGLISSPETALAILEKYQVIYPNKL